MDDHTDLPWILSVLPKHEQEEAEKRIKLALEVGWRSIGVWGSWDFKTHRPHPPSLDNIFGIHPHTGMCDHVHPITIEKSKIQPTIEEVEENRRRLDDFLKSIN